VRKLLAVLLLSSIALAGRVEHLRENRRARVFSGNSIPLLAAFTSSGTGTFGVCSTTAPTATKGEVLTATRASNATCQKTATGGLAVTAVADGDLVTLSSNQSRVEYNNAGVLGLRLEPTAATDDCLQGEEICDIAWSDVGTPSCTANQKSGPWNTATMDLLTDNDGAAFEGRSQGIVTTSATKHGVACYIKGGTSLEASVTLVGTGSATGDCTGASTTLSTTTSTRVFCVSTAAYEATLVAATVTVRVGDATGDQGTIYVESCDHFDSIVDGYLPSTVRTTSSAVTRAAEGVPTFPFVAANGSIVAIAVTVTTSHTPTTGTTLATPSGSGNPSLLGRFSAGNFGCYQMTAGGDVAAGTWTAGTNRWACSTQRMAHLRGTTNTASASTVTATLSELGIGSTGGFGTAVPGIYTDLGADVGSYLKVIP
jgi:hypothetical protein